MKKKLRATSTAKEIKQVLPCSTTVLIPANEWYRPEKSALRRLIYGTGTLLRRCQEKPTFGLDPLPCLKAGEMNRA
jgi:hypothetical protein